MDNIDEAFLEQFVFPIIGYAGEGKSLAHEALQMAKKNDFLKADELIKKSNEVILEAHHIQASLITKEADGDSIPITMLFVHAEDHLMSAISERELIREMIDILRRISDIEKKLN